MALEDRYRKENYPRDIDAPMAIDRNGHPVTISDKAAILIRRFGGFEIETEAGWAFCFGAGEEGPTEPEGSVCYGSVWARPWPIRLWAVPVPDGLLF